MAIPGDATPLEVKRSRGREESVPEHEFFTSRDWDKRPVDEAPEGSRAREAADRGRYYRLGVTYDER